MCMSRQLLKKKKGGVHDYSLQVWQLFCCVACCRDCVLVFKPRLSLQVCPVCVLEHGQCFRCLPKKKWFISCNCAVKVSTPCECMCVLSVRVMLHHVVTPRKIVLNGDANFSLKVQLLFASAHSSWQEP